MVDNHVGSAAAATHIFGFLVLCSIISGIAFEKIAKWCGKYTVAIFDIVTALAMMAVPFVGHQARAGAGSRQNRP